MQEKTRIKAVGLVSGGLDSVLASQIIVDQGIEVIGLHMITPFSSGSARTPGGESMVLKQARTVGFRYYPLHLGEEYIELIKNPRWGYGSCMNPCIDCHIYFLQKAGEVMREEEALFVFTGEVLAQRPMSQKRPTLRMIEKRCGLEGYLLRPLSALRLEPTIPEKLGWVDRTGLLGLAGRSRKEQMALAEQYGIEDYQTPAGGCLLTDPRYSARLKDLFDHDISDINSIQLIKVGRQFRLDAHNKLIVGRNESDNRILANLALDTDVLLEAEGGGSPLSILRGGGGDKIIRLSAAITRRYSRARKNLETPVRVRRADSDTIEKIIPEPLSSDAIESLHI